MMQKPQIEKFLENPLYHHGNETLLVQADTPKVVKQIHDNAAAQMSSCQNKLPAAYSQDLAMDALIFLGFRELDVTLNKGVVIIQVNNTPVI